MKGRDFSQASDRSEIESTLASNWQRSSDTIPEISNIGLSKLQLLWKNFLDVDLRKYLCLYILKANYVSHLIKNEILADQRKEGKNINK